LGMTMNPQGAHYTLMGIETLSLRMERHVANAQVVAEFLETHPAVEKVTYPGLKSSPYHNLAKMITPKGPGALFTVALKSGYEGCVKFVDHLKLFSHVANLGDARSLVIHPASTTHRQLSDEQRVSAGAAPNMVRLSIGTEDVRDIMADLDQALKAAG
ncbi:MAG: PLP-dependent transferase, partial [Deltaproteobacteria bacterium]